MVLDYSKWDALELSDDSDIEVHPNVDKKSFIRAKQNQIHQQRQQRRHQIETLKYERIVNDGLLKRIDALLKALSSHHDSNESPDELVFQSLIESAGDPAEDKPPSPPEGIHSQVEEQPTYSKMMAALVDQVKHEIDGAKPENRFEGYITGVKGHQTKVFGLQQQLLEKLAELEREESRKITSDSIRTGFNTSHVAAAKDYSATSSTGMPATGSEKTVELLNTPKRDALPHRDSYQDSGADADVEDDASGLAEDDNALTQPSALGKAFAKIKSGDYAASLQFISQNPTVLAERETDGLLVRAFDLQRAGKDEEARDSVHHALLLQYCRSLGRDGVALFFRRITTPNHQARKIFFDDVNSTYARLKARTVEMARESEADANDNGEREQIQLHAVNPDTKISITVPPSGVAEYADARAIFESFPPGLQRALEHGSLDEVNKVLGHMSVDEAEEVVAKLDQGGMLNMEEGIIDATTEEGQKQIEEIERTKKMPDRPGVDTSEPDAVMDMD